MLKYFNVVLLHAQGCKDALQMHDVNRANLVLSVLQEMWDCLDMQSRTECCNPDDPWLLVRRCLCFVDSLLTEDLQCADDS